MNNNQDISKLYESHDEDERLRTRWGNVEFESTTEILGMLLKPNDRILDIGAGTGAYSIYYAERGYSVTAIELVRANYDKLCAKIKSSMNITPICADARDLSQFENNSFDVILCAGPMYHIPDVEDRHRLVDECYRVCKSGGYIAIAYITNDAPLIDCWFCRPGGEQPDVSTIYDDNFKRRNDNSNFLFKTHYPSEMKNYFRGYRTNYVGNFATDGISRIIRDKLDVMSEKEYEVYKKWHKTNMHRRDMIGLTSHGLYVVKKW